MSIDYGEVERQFLATLKEDTGRSLDEWMAAIAAQGLAHRNDVIDWLRRQGFMFSKASWLERIHNNGGRPIYEGMAGQRPRAPAAPRPPRLSPVAPPLPRVEPPIIVQAPPPSPQPPASEAEAAASLEALIARAKAFRPLAAYVISEIRKAVPGVAVVPQDGHVVFRTDADFAVLVIGPKELRLGIAAKEAPGPPWDASRLPVRGVPATTHLVVLTDARQITPSLTAAVARAASAQF